MTEDRALKLRIISPNGIFYEGKTIMVELNTTEGRIGVYKNHVPMTYILEPGIITITESEACRKEAELDSGFVQILQAEVTVLAENVTWTGQ